MKTSHHRRWITILIAGVMAPVVLVMAAVPTLVRGHVEARLKTHIASSIDAHVDWRGVRLGLFRDFPNLTLRVDDLVVTGVDRFTADTLLAVPRARLVLDLATVVGSVRRGEAVVVRALELSDPAARLLVLEDGAANWDIARQDSRAHRDPAGRPLQLALRSFAVHGGSITLDDRQSGLLVSASGLRQSLRGDLATHRVAIRTRAAADQLSLRFAGIPYLSGARLDVQADLDLDTDSRTLAVRDNTIRLNGLRLELDGTAGLRTDGVDLDLAFHAPGTGFDEILSLVPAVYASDFDAIHTSGTMTVAGWVRGLLGPGAFPALALDASIQDGTLRYPDLPLPARDIQLDLALSNAGGDPDLTILELRRFHLVLGDHPIHGSLALQTPISDPEVDLALHGRVDLADLRRTFKIDGVDEIAGLVVADATVRARRSDLDAQRYDRVAADGTLALSDVALRARDLRHPLLVHEARLRLSPAHAELLAFRARAGNSDVAITGTLHNLLGFALLHEELRGHVRLASTRIDLDEWRSDDDARAIPLPAGIDLALEAAIGRVTLGDLVMTDARGSLRLNGQRLTLHDFHTDMLGGTLALTGHYETTTPERPTFDMDLRLADADVPATFAAMATARAFAPVARYATGRASVDVRLAGALEPDLSLVHDVLGGAGTFRTQTLHLQGFPPLDRLAETLELPLLRDPGFVDVRSTFVIRDGRLHVSPFPLRLGELALTVSGSNGMDQSLDYVLGLELPRSVLGAGAERVVTSLISRSTRAGLELGAADVVALSVEVTGTVASPALRADFRGLTQSATRTVAQAVRREADRGIEAAEQRLDEAAEAARLRAAAESARIMAETEARAAAIRAEARSLADAIRREGAEQADALLAGAASPAARLAARPAADRLRRAADERADRLVREADATADALLAEALRRTGGGAPEPTTRS
jgi:hypothetical protein